MGVLFIVLDDALNHLGKPKIFNTDQGCQFTSEVFTSVLKGHKIKISMDGKGRWMDNVFVERLWHSLKYEEVCLKVYETPAQEKAGIKTWIECFNQRPDTVHLTTSSHRIKFA